MFTDTTADELRRREALAFTRFVTVVRETPPEIPVADGAWNAGQVAAHVLTVMRRYTERDVTSPVGLSPTMAGVDAQNREELEAVQHLSPAEVLEALVAEQERVLAIDLDLDASYPFHFNQQIDGKGGWGNAIGELLIHGLDIARAGGHPWTIDPRDAALVLNAMFQVMAGLVNPDVTRSMTATIEFRPKGGCPQSLVIDRGSASVVDASRCPARPDVILAGPPTPLMLQLHGRLSTPRAALRGVGIRGGRRPWLGLRLPKIFDAPMG